MLHGALPYFAAWSPHPSNPRGIPTPQPSIPGADDLYQMYLIFVSTQIKQSTVVMAKLQKMETTFMCATFLKYKLCQIVLPHPTVGTLSASNSPQRSQLMGCINNEVAPEVQRC